MVAAALAVAGHQAELPLAPVDGSADTARGCWPSLADCKQPVVFFDQRMSSTSRLSFDVTDDGLIGELATDGQRLQLADVTAVYLRLQDDRQFRDVRKAGPESAYAQHVSGLHAGLVEWTEITPALVVNRFSRQQPTVRSPIRRIHACGFATPPTLITREPERVREFQREHGAADLQVGQRDPIDRLRGD
jgi:hypothetical protein